MSERAERIRALLYAPGQQPRYVTDPVWEAVVAGLSLLAGNLGSRAETVVEKAVMWADEARWHDRPTIEAAFVALNADLRRWPLLAEFRDALRAQALAARGPAVRGAPVLCSRCGSTTLMELAEAGGRLGVQHGPPCGGPTPTTTTTTTTGVSDGTHHENRAAGVPARSGSAAPPDRGRPIADGPTPDDRPLRARAPGRDRPGPRAGQGRQGHGGGWLRESLPRDFGRREGPA